MIRARNEIIASIARAKIELDGALEDVKSLPMVDPMTFGFVTHALNNYLHVTLGTVGLLSDALRKHPNADVAIWLSGLQEVTKRMSNLVQEMRSGAKQTAPDIHLEKLNLGLLVGRACHFYRRAASRKQVEVIYENPSPALPKVRADRLAVAAILDNLLSNALKFTPPGKRITVVVRPDGNSVVCEVRDEGLGVSPRDQANLFHRATGSKARATSGGATQGFGLAVASELVAHLGGEIGCESESGRGACFFFRLPCPPNNTRPKRPK